ncbi:hypothetical protein MOBT1_000768 [Malassezia obtusa]|uniref:Alpha-1,3/1,6-mannosyltransferase ALG2 n=1 Tax=Malassezia obtusa TaxID=76774 RepID=A0AAF0ISE4_9BASI|nr:hypothetical protein MOBT1_000768 [Malassezia obtusa]
MCSASLAAQRGTTGWIRNLYRLPLDLLEEVTTAFADVVVANSKFTANHFRRSFPRLQSTPHVIYPGVDENEYQSTRVTRELAAFLTGRSGNLEKQMQDVVGSILSDRSRPMFLSINRFEAKKNIALAVETFARLRQEVGNTELRLICAGGYDHRVLDNIETLAALQSQAARLGLSHVTLWCSPPMYEPPISPPSLDQVNRAAIIFFPSFPGPLLHTLLVNPAVRALLYTPTNEHFGIVPLEAMACGMPVVATNTGGPLETIVDADVDRTGEPRARGATGFLLPPDPAAWAAVCATILGWDQRIVEHVATNAKRRVAEVFSVRAMGELFDEQTNRLAKMPPVSTAERIPALALVLVILLLGTVLGVAMLSLALRCL